MCGIVGFTGNQQVARFCWMVCLKWNIEDVIRPDWLSAMAKPWRRSSRQKAVCLI